MKFLLNALPGAIIPAQGISLDIWPTKPEDVPEDVVSAIGHADTATIVSGILGREIPCNRISVPPLKDQDEHYLALYQGPRLPEGTTVLPEGATLTFYRLHASALSYRWPE